MVKSIFLVLCLMLAAANMSFAQQKEDFIFFYDFNDEEVGKPPSEPWKPTAQGDIVVEDFPSAANKSVRVKDNGTGGGMGLILDDPIEDKTVSLEFKWLLKESAGSDVEIFYVMNQQCPDDWSGVCIAMVPGKTSILEYHDNAWVQFGKIKPDVWHEFKIVMHLADNKYDFYYDDQQVVKNAAFRKYDGIKGIDKFNVANIGDGGTTFDTYFDDIMLYEGTKRPVSVDPMSSLPTEWGEIKKGA